MNKIIAWPFPSSNMASEKILKIFLSYWPILLYSIQFIPKYVCIAILGNICYPLKFSCPRDAFAKIFQIVPMSQWIVKGLHLKLDILHSFFHSRRWSGLIYRFLRCLLHGKILGGWIIKDYFICKKPSVLSLQQFCHLQTRWRKEKRENWKWTSSWSDRGDKRIFISQIGSTPSATD